MPPVSQKKATPAPAPAPAPMPPAPTTRAAAAPAPAPKKAAPAAPKRTAPATTGEPVWPGENASDEAKAKWERDFQAYATSLGGQASTAPYGKSTVATVTEPVSALTAVLTRQSMGNNLEPQKLAPRPAEAPTIQGYDELRRISEERRARAAAKREGELTAAREARTVGGFAGTAAGTAGGIGAGIAGSPASGWQAVKQAFVGTPRFTYDGRPLPSARLAAAGRIGGLAALGATIGSLAQDYVTPEEGEYAVPADAMVPVPPESDGQKFPLPYPGAATGRSPARLAAPLLYGDQQKFYPPEGAEFSAPLFGQAMTRPEEMYRRRREISPEVYADPDAYETVSRLYEQAYRRSKSDVARATPAQYRDVAQRVAALKSIMLGELGYTPAQLAALKPE